MSIQSQIVSDPYRRILVVDDHPGTAKTLALALSNLGGDVDVVAATSGYEALEVVSEKQVDVLITDLMMPGMSGLELFEKMQSHPGGRPIFTCLITAYDVPGLKETARRLNINEIVIKPFGPERIVQIVGDALEKIHQPTTPVSQEGSPLAKILIADDQPDNVALMARYMKVEGYSYVSASNGVEALEMARRELPDLILLDVNMPEKDGFTVLADLRADPLIAHIPVIIFTAARLHPEDVQMGLNLGADDYITKPFDRRELLARIRAKLRVKMAEDMLRRHNKELSILPEIGKELSARHDVNELGDLVLRRTVETLGAMAGHLIFLNPKAPIHKEYCISDASCAEMKLPPLNDLLQNLKEGHESILIEDTHANASWGNLSWERANSVLIVPMHGRFDLIGLLILIHERKNYFNAGHQVLLQAIASQASIAVENARLYTEVSQEQERTAAVLEGVADAILMFDADGCISMWNSAAEKLFSVADVKPGLPIVRGRGYDALIDALEGALDSGKSFTDEIRWPDQRDFNAFLTPLDGGGCVALLHDVSHFKTLERVKNEFVATASHDLRNPLTSIKGYIQLIQNMGPLNENQVDFAKRIKNAVEHMTELVENMLDLAKMDLGVELRGDVEDLMLIVAQLVDEFEPQAKAKEQSLTIEKKEPSLIVKGDALQLRQALRNLIGNAIKYTPNEGTILISIEKHTETVALRIRDTGYGIPAADLPHIFDRFYRVRNNGHDEIEGNGLGLAIVKTIIQKHGGDISVESEPGEGTHFTVTLPLFTETMRQPSDSESLETVKQ